MIIEWNLSEIAQHDDAIDCYALKKWKTMLDDEIFRFLYKDTRDNSILSLVRKIKSLLNRLPLIIDTKKFYSSFSVSLGNWITEGKKQQKGWLYIC